MYDKNTWIEQIPKGLLNELEVCKDGTSLNQFDMFNASYDNIGQLDFISHYCDHESGSRSNTRGIFDDHHTSILYNKYDDSSPSGYWGENVWIARHLF